MQTFTIFVAKTNHDEDPNLTVKEISERAKVSEAAVKKFIIKNDLGSKHEQNFFIKLRKIETAMAKLSKFDEIITNNAIAEHTGLSTKTVVKYRKIIKEKSEKKSTKKVAYFTASNNNVVKSVSDNQSQILMWALKLYAPHKKIDFDLTYSCGGFYKNGGCVLKSMFFLTCVHSLYKRRLSQKLSSGCADSLRSNMCA